MSELIVKGFFGIFQEPLVRSVHFLAVVLQFLTVQIQGLNQPHKSGAVVAEQNVFVTLFSLLLVINPNCFFIGYFFNYGINLFGRKDTAHFLFSLFVPNRKVKSGAILKHRLQNIIGTGYRINRHILFTDDCANPVIPIYNSVVD